MVAAIRDSFAHDAATVSVVEDEIVGAPHEGGCSCKVRSVLQDGLPICEVGGRSVDSQEVACIMLLDVIEDLVVWDAETDEAQIVVLVMELKKEVAILSVFSGAVSLPGLSVGLGDVGFDAVEAAVVLPVDDDVDSFLFGTGDRRTRGVVAVDGHDTLEFFSPHLPGGDTGIGVIPNPFFVAQAASPDYCVAVVLMASIVLVEIVDEQRCDVLQRKDVYARLGHHLGLLFAHTSTEGNAVLSYSKEFEARRVA
mmetsp:Transcript_7739/g.23594  ORF Transcript_7739/g.23594 Transcript_7739/m.23594 type:complete len:253 (-) Transcript_7739:734-1492(-)